MNNPDSHRICRTDLGVFTVIIDGIALSQQEHYRQ